MTKADSLEEAIEYRNRLRAVRQFRHGFDDWKGSVEIVFGSYRATISHAAWEEIDHALSVEEKQLRNTLEMLEVVMDEDAGPI